MQPGFQVSVDCVFGFCKLKGNK